MTTSKSGNIPRKMVTLGSSSSSATLADSAGLDGRLGVSCVSLLVCELSVVGAFSASSFVARPDSVLGGGTIGSAANACASAVVGGDVRSNIGEVARTGVGATAGTGVSVPAVAVAVTPDVASAAAGADVGASSVCIAMRVA